MSTTTCRDRQPPILLLDVTPSNRDGPDITRPYFFVHVMKTAGLTFNRHIEANFGRESIFPGTDDETGVDYWVIRNLEKAVIERADGIQMWRGHFPFYVTSLLADPVTLTVVREPVARIVSLLEQRKVLESPDKHIEEIYEDPVMYEREIHDHQTKVFSMRADDGAGAWIHAITLNDERLAAAKATLETVEVLGCQERFDEFLEQLRSRYRWRITEVESTNVGTEPTASSAFRRRIAEDNQLDLELYEHARSLIG